MTFVDLVFPAFLFIVGMSVPSALRGRHGERAVDVDNLGHVPLRTLSLMGIGILMVHEMPDSKALVWSGSWWCGRCTRSDRHVLFVLAGFIEPSIEKSMDGEWSALSCGLGW